MRAPLKIKSHQVISASVQEKKTFQSSQEKVFVLKSSWAVQPWSNERLVRPKSQALRPGMSSDTNHSDGDLKCQQAQKGLAPAVSYVLFSKGCVFLAREEEGRCTSWLVNGLCFLCKKSTIEHARSHLFPVCQQARVYGFLCLLTNILTICISNLTYPSLMIIQFCARPKGWEVGWGVWKQRQRGHRKLKGKERKKKKGIRQRKLIVHNWFTSTVQNSVFISLSSLTIFSRDLPSTKPKRNFFQNLILPICYPQSL